MRSTAARSALPAALAIVALLAIVAVAPAPAAAQSAENGTTTFDFELGADGDARVSVTTRIALAEESDRQAFDRLAEEHRNGDGSPLSVEPFERAAARATEATGRSMDVRDVSLEAGRSNGTGRLSVAFTWTNFTEVSEERLVVGDAFRTPGGTWFPRLTENQELVISFPQGYTPQSISTPGARYQLVNGTVYVEGPASFEPGTPTVVLRQTGGTQSEPTPAISPAVAAVAAVAALLAVLALLAFLFRGRLPFPGAGAGAEGSNVEETGEDEPGGTGGTDESDPMSEPLLSDEERVLKLLEASDGRMKQVDIVEATDWSNAKVSQLLSEMEEADQVDKLRIGRENLISLPGHGPGSE